MSKAIIRTKPSPTGTHPGKAILTEVTQPEWNNRALLGTSMDYNHWSGDDNSKIGDLVECTITGPWKCDVTKYIEPSALSQGIITSKQGEVKVLSLCNPNPFNIKIDDKLTFDVAANSELKENDRVNCLPTSNFQCDIVK